MWCPAQGGEYYEEGNCTGSCRYDGIFPGSMWKQQWFDGGFGCCVDDSGSGIHGSGACSIDSGRGGVHRCGSGSLDGNWQHGG